MRYECVYTQWEYTHCRDAKQLNTRYSSKSDTLPDLNLVGSSGVLSWDIQKLSHVAAVIFHYAKHIVFHDYDSTMCLFLELEAEMDYDLDA